MSQYCMTQLFLRYDLFYVLTYKGREIYNLKYIKAA